MKDEFRQIEHTADVAIEAEAPDLAGLFDRCAAGMFSLIAEDGGIEPREEHQIKVQGADLAELLVAFLRELAWLHADRGFMYAGASFASPSFERGDEDCPEELAATVRGETADPDRHRLVREIKAVTYHDLRVERQGDGWYARVIFDV